MKKLYFISIFFVLCGISIFGSNETQEEVDFLLFLPNSSNSFVNEEQAFIQLDNLAQYLSNKNLVPGQIIVYGYAAFAPNKIKSVDLSKERAFFVMNELQKRGVPKELFSEPVGYGSVNLWGNNANENDRKLNRRARILLDGVSPVPITQEIMDAETDPEPVILTSAYEKPAAQENTSKETNFRFPWWLLILFTVFMFLLLLLLMKMSRNPVEKSGNTTADIISDSDSSAASTANKVNLDQEIRVRAFELSRRHNEQDNYREQDWYNAVREISAWYTACGHSVFYDGRFWWASI